MALYRGFSTISNSFDSSKLTDNELIKRDLLNHFSIAKGEKLGNPNFGSSISDLIMEPLNEETKDLILQEVNEIINYDPRIQPENIVVDEFEQGIQIQISLLYVESNQTENMLIQFNRDSGTVS
jgi:phage baseplate assembly protein W|tara:strand:- start:2039 stop:2410 length:372 start_codon:yes stop_codon:yes gene_type:complete